MKSIGIAIAGLLFSIPLAGQDYDFSKVNSLIDAHLHLLEEGVAVIVKRGDTVLFERFEGITADTPKPVASATKWFAGTMMLLLAEKGLFGLDDRISEYVSEFASPTDPALSELTIRQAFSMSTGMFPADQAQKNYHRNPAFDLDSSVALMAQNIDVVYGPPGTQIAYYGGGMQAAGAVAVRLTGRSWESLCREYLFDPLGLEDTHTLHFDPNPAIAGGLVTTPNDYMKFLDMLAAQGLKDDKIILGSASISEMWRRQSGDAPVRETPWPSNHPRYLHGLDTPIYSFGAWIMAEDPDMHFVEEISSPGAFGTCPWIDRKRGLHGIIFLDLPAGNDVNWDFQLEIMALVREAVDEADGRCRQLSPEGANWIDPEFLSGANWATWQDGELNGWVSPVDPHTGDLIDPQIFVSDLAPLVTTINAPEFGLDAEGWSIIYTKRVGQFNQLWKATYEDSGWTHTSLTSGSISRGGPIISRDPTLTQTWIAYIRGTVQNGNIYCLREDEPDNEIFITPFLRGITNGAWVPGAPEIIYTDANGALNWMEVTSGQRVLISDEADLYTSPSPILAVEQNRLIVGAIADESAIVVYARSPADPNLWERVEEISLPLGATRLGYNRFESLETFSFEGNTWFVCHIEKPGDIGTYGEAQIWLVGLANANHDRLWRRLDSGTSGVLRTEAEWYIGTSDAIVYHTVIDQSTQEIWAAAANLGGLGLLPSLPRLENSANGLLLSWGGKGELFQSEDLIQWSPLPAWGNRWTVSLPTLDQRLFFRWKPVLGVP